MVRSEITSYVLTSYDYKNSGLIVKLLTEQGLKTCFGRGFKNIKNNKNIYHNNFIKLLINGSIEDEFISIESEKIVSYNQMLTTNLKTNEILNLISELILKTEQLHNSYELFDFSVKHLTKDNHQQIVIMWLLHLYFKLNNECNLTMCSNCQNLTNITYFDPFSGGYLCSNCTNKTMSLTELKVIKKAYSHDYESLFQINNHEQLIKIFTDYFINGQGMYLKVLEKYVRNL